MAISTQEYRKLSDIISDIYRDTGALRDKLYDGYTLMSSIASDWNEEIEESLDAGDYNKESQHPLYKGAMMLEEAFEIYDAVADGKRSAIETFESNVIEVHGLIMELEEK